MPAWNDLVLYELHIGTFNAQPGAVGTFDEAIARLDYLRDLGVSGVEVMPAEDFDTETSWGYNPALPFALDNAYAGGETPAGTSKVVQRFVQAAHGSGGGGIAVVFDVVYHHLGPEGLGDCLWQFDGWSNGYGDLLLQRRARLVRLGRADFGRPEVRQFFRDNAMMWLHDFQADGLHLDSVLNVRRAIGHDGVDRGNLPEGWALLQSNRRRQERRPPVKIAIAEDLQNDDWITRDTGAGGAASTRSGTRSSATPCARRSPPPRTRTATWAPSRRRSPRPTTAPGCSSASSMSNRTTRPRCGASRTSSTPAAQTGGTRASGRRSRRVSCSRRPECHALPGARVSRMASVERPAAPRLEQIDHLLRNSRISTATSSRFDATGTATPAASRGTRSTSFT